MPFTLDDLDRISVPFGTGRKTLGQLSDTQFTAWLRAQGARGEIGLVTVAPGQTAIPVEERLRVLNDLEQEGFYIEGVMGQPRPEQRPDAARLTEAQALLQQAEDALRGAEGVLADLGEFDWRVNMRASIGGAIQLVELMRGAAEAALRQADRPAGGSGAGASG